MLSRRVLFVAAVAASASLCRAALTFNLSDGEGLIALSESDPVLYAQVESGFAAAANLWSAQIANNITVKVSIDYADLGAGILGQASHTSRNVTYASVRSALLSHSTSAADAIATAHLPAGPNLQFYTNNTAANPSNRYLDQGSNNWNTRLSIPTANAKALGLSSYTGADATITFSNAFTWDFTHSASMASNSIDFVGVAAHEIGHALGFVSGVDMVDQYSYPNGPAAGISLSDLAVFSTLDLFRHKADDGGILDLSTGGSAYLSLDGGITSLGAMSGGAYNGTDSPKYQASHWQQSTGWLMKPAIAYGHLADLSTADLQAMDVIGYTLVPEPGISFIAITMAFPALSGRRRR